METKKVTIPKHEDDGRIPDPDARAADPRKLEEDAPNVRPPDVGDHNG